MRVANKVAVFRQPSAALECFTPYNIKNGTNVMYNLHLSQTPAPNLCSPSRLFKSIHRTLIDD